MIVAYNEKTKEKIPKEKMRAIVINEGIWHGISDEHHMDSYLKFTIKKENDSYTAIVDNYGLTLEAKNIRTFDLAYFYLDHLEAVMLRGFSP